jgi:PAS domain S-box-containing protein
VGAQINGARGICHDVSFYKEAEEQVRLSESRYRSLFEDSSIGMTLVTATGNWLKVNPAFCEIVGYSEAELLKMTFQEMTIPEDLEQDQAIMAKFRNEDFDKVRIRKRFYHKDGHLIWVNVNISLIRDGGKKPLYFVAQVEDVTALKSVEDEKERARYQLNERVKELTAMYRTSQLLSDDRKSIDDSMQQIVNMLPEGWQYPDSTVSRISFDGHTYRSNNYRDPVSIQRAEFTTSYGASGSVEVGYTEEKPEQQEGPFLTEERKLINVIAEMIRVCLDRKHEADELSRWEANLTATINNTETLIWSVDRDLKLMTFNKPFAQHVKTHYGVNAMVGQAQYEIKVDSEISEYWSNLTKKWIGFFQRALAGEKFSTEEFNVGKFLRYSLSPIVVNGQIIGVSVYANDITEQKQHELEMREMNKKVGELKLMALRSVMNPHFIFNVLNSIQYFIAKNDRINAINYLSTFSKLIRSILTHSTGDKIRLQEEIEMIKNYVDLEQTRFENKFTFELNIDNDVEVDNIEIPSLLIQPYIENAILHGLYNKTGPGKLSINVKEDNECLLFEIIDDGIGREAAQKLKDKNMTAHKSMGIKITEERLKLINEHHNVSFAIEDRKDANGDPTGTTIRVWIKY